MFRAMLASICLTAAPAFAGSPEIAPWTHPCSHPMPSRSDYEARVLGMDPAEAWDMALILRHHRCGDVAAPAMIWTRPAGPTDAELIAFVLPGHDLPPAPVPLSASGVMLAMALVGLGVVAVVIGGSRGRNDD